MSTQQIMVTNYNLSTLIKKMTEEKKRNQAVLAEGTADYLDGVHRIDKDIETIYNTLLENECKVPRLHEEGYGFFAVPVEIDNPGDLFAIYRIK